jgi:hypothetical protein
MQKGLFTKIISVFLLLSFVLEGRTGFFVLIAAAQTSPTDILIHRAQLEADLATIEKEIDAQQSILDNQARQSVSLGRDVAILTAQIQKAKLSIRARTLTIEGLVSDIGSKNKTIVKYSAKIDREHDSLAGLLRRTDELDRYSLPEVALSDKPLSEFFGDLDIFQYVEDAVAQSLSEVGVAKKATEEEKIILEQKKTEETDLRKIQELEKKRIESDESEKKRILKESKGQEALYQKVLKEKKQSAAQIRAELFSLQGSAAIPFERALEYANFANSKTGVRPALILGIVAEESNLGQNVGKGTWTVDMHPTRDVPIFKDITARLGLNPDQMPVSKKVWYGWGGAMGPAQFIPSTWILFEERVSELTGHTPANPWDPRDAFMASALLLEDNGAAKGGYIAEHRAAMCYLAGCANAKKRSLQFYGDDVLALAKKYQNQIDILNGN